MFTLGGIFCPLQLGNFLAILQIFAWGGNFCPLQLGVFLAIPQIFAWWGIYCPLQLGDFLEIFGSFVSRVIFCAHHFSDFWRFLEVFISRVIICALQACCGVSCVLEEFPVFWIVDCREDCWAYRLVVCCGVMLCEVICQVLCARSPVIMELSLGVAAP